MAREKFVCIDAHTCGNPVRLVREGGPGLTGKNMSEKRLHFLREFDHIRKGLMFEPRGHDMMSGSILYPPTDPANDLAVLFIETSGCLPMCGHGTIGTVTIAIEEGLVKPGKEGELRLETPAGLVLVSYEYDGKRVRSVKITNVPSYLEAKNLQVDCPDLGLLTLDVAYGGNFYAIIDPQENFTGIQDVTAEQLVIWSRAVRSRLNEHHSFVHPEDPSINGLSHVMWTGSPTDPLSTARNAVFYGDKAIDRSPCGTGTSARMAQWYSQGRLMPGDKFIHESYIGCKFTGTIEGVTTVKGKPAIIPGIEGWARVTGYNTIFLDDDDPYNHGFQVI
jgi:4-hydroxyproline epimerase